MKASTQHIKTCGTKSSNTKERSLQSMLISRNCKSNTKQANCISEKARKANSEVIPR